MTAIRITGWLASVLLAVSATGCGSTPPSRFYTLASTATATGQTTHDSGIMVGPVSVPASVDRPEFVLQVTPNRVEVQEFDRWAAPLGESIARTVAGDLAKLLGTRNVATAPFVNFDPAYRVSINVQRFDSMQASGVVLDAAWAVRTVKGGKTRSGRTVAQESAGTAGFEALAAAHSRAIAKLSADIAAALRAAVAAGD